MNNKYTMEDLENMVHSCLNLAYSLKHNKID